VAAIVVAEGTAPGAGADRRGEPAPGEEQIEAIAIRLARRLGSDAVGGAAAGLACVFVPDPDAPGRRRQIAAAAEAEREVVPEAGGEPRDAARAVEAGPVVLGPTVGWAEAGRSLKRAAAAFRMGDGDGLLVADDHLVSLLLRADPELAADLAATRLAPLADLADGPRAKLTETLKAWLDRPGQVQAVAADLGVHPQTVRYRLRQLRELFGTRLEDPDARFELALALRVV
jgi:DNA-binding PucR family transcriptional regulator